jgi:UPF0716 protein FxsA
MPSLGLIILLLLVALPLLEIAVFIKIGSIIGVWLTLTIIVSTFILGLWVVRLQGMGVARRFMAATRSGEPPVEPMMEAMLLMVAGGCLIAPGFITDTIGLLLLVPPLRQTVARWIIARGFPLAVRMKQTRTYQRPHAPGTRSRRADPAPTIEADYERIDEKPLPPGQRPRPGEPSS